MSGRQRPPGAKAFAGGHLAFVVALPLALVTLVVPSFAQERGNERGGEPDASVPSSDPAAEARRRYNLGTQAFRANHFVEAALNFEAAAAQRPHAVTLYTAAMAWEQAGVAERAADDFGRALDIPGLSPPQQASARERLAAYEGMLGTVEVHGPEGTRVQLDGFTEVSVPARLHGAAGVRSLTARAASKDAPLKDVARRDLVLEAGQTLRLDLTDASLSATPADRSPLGIRGAVPSLVESTPPPRESTSRLDLRRALGFTSLGLGVASAAGAVVLGVSALGARDAFVSAPTSEGLHHARSLETWTTAAWIGAGALGAVGVALILWPGGESVRVVSTSNGAAAVGVF